MQFHLRLTRFCLFVSSSFVRLTEWIWLIEVRNKIGNKQIDCKSFTVNLSTHLYAIELDHNHTYTKTEIEKYVICVDDDYDDDRTQYTQCIQSGLVKCKNRSNFVISFFNGPTLCVELIQLFVICLCFGGSVHTQLIMKIIYLTLAILFVISSRSFDAIFYLISFIFFAFHQLTAQICVLDFNFCRDFFLHQQFNGNVLF